MTVIFLANGIPWFGAHSGEGAMLPHLARSTHLHTIAPRRTSLTRTLGKIHSALRGWPPRDQSISWAECQALALHRWLPSSVLHLLRSEEHVLLLGTGRPRRRVVGTVHLPACRWSPEYRHAISRLTRAIVYFQAAIPDLESFIPRESISFIHDGVDTEFFTRGEGRSFPPRLLFAGVYLRNTAMLARVVRRLAALRPDLGFDLLVPKHRREEPGLVQIKDHPAVTWHAGLSDEQLRALYQKSYLLLLPMNESGANTAVVEALACGLPIVTTDVGGIRDYGGGSIFPVVANDDDDAMIALVERYLAQPAWREEIATVGRSFAENTLAWPLVAARHVAVYRELAQ